MTTTRTTKLPMDADRKATLAAGLFYLGTFAFSIPALGLYKGVLDDPNFVLGAGSDQGVLWGGFIEILTALTGRGSPPRSSHVVRTAHQVRSYGRLVQYEIRVEGHLGARWAAWFDGLSLSPDDDGITVIRGPLVDQAALHGLLLKLRDVGLPLISLTPLPPTTPEGT